MSFWCFGHSSSLYSILTRAANQQLNLKLSKTSQ